MEIPEGIIDLLKGNDNEDKASSGMHWPNEDISGWDVPNSADDEEIGNKDIDSLEDVLSSFLKKKALGLTDIPASIGQGIQTLDGSSTEVLGSNGIPQNPGLSREEGDDEETDFYGSTELIEPKSSIPGKNEKYQNNRIAYLKHVDNLKNMFMSFGMDDNVKRIETIIKKSNSLDEYIARYKNVKEALKNAASQNSIKMDYDTGFMTGEVSFLFENGRWTYDHSMAPEISNPSVSDIASGKVDPTIVGGITAILGAGMSEEYMKLISGLASNYNNDLPGGIAYLYENRGTGSFDATFPSEIPSMFYGIYKELKKTFGATSPEDLDMKLGLNPNKKVVTDKSTTDKPIEQPEIVAPIATPALAQELETWDSSGLTGIKELWESYASKGGLDPSFSSFISWHDGNYERLGIRTKSKTIAFLSGAPGEKSNTKLPEPISTQRETSPISTNNQEVDSVKKISTREILEKTIKEILEGKALGTMTDNRMEGYLKRVGGSKENLKPLIDQIIMQTKPAELIKMLQDPEKKYRSVLRQARKATRTKILEGTK